MIYTMGTASMIYIQPTIPIIWESIQINAGNNLHTTVFQVSENLVGICSRHTAVHLKTTHGRKHVLGIFAKKQAIIQLGTESITFSYGLRCIQNTPIR